MTVTIGAYDSTTGQVPFSFVYNGLTYNRKVFAALDGSGNYDAAATALAINNQVERFTNAGDINYILSVIPGGDLASDRWTKVGTFYYLVLFGTGNATFDTLDHDGTVTTDVTTIAANNGASRITYNFGDMVQAIRATFTGTASGKVVV